MRTMSTILLACLGLTASVHAQTFTAIHTLGTQGSFGQRPSLNNQGEVAYWLRTADFNTGIGIDGSNLIVGNGTSSQNLVGKTSTSTSGAFFGISSDPVINDSGNIAFTANLSTVSRGLFWTDGSGPVEALGVGSALSGTGGLNNFGQPTINNDDVVAALAFYNGLPQSNGGIRIWAGTPGSAGPVVTTGPNYFFMYDPAINNDGTIVFSGQAANQAAGVFQYNPTLTVASTSNGFQTFGVDVDTNDLGQTLFTGVQAGVSGLWLNNGTDNTKIHDTAGAFASFIDLSLNNAGDIAFYASLDAAAGKAIYSGPNGNIPIIATGQSILGKQVSDLGMSTSSLNDAGQIAFWARFTDNTQGIFRYDPLGSTALNPVLPTSTNGTFPLLFSVAAGDFGLGRSVPIFIDPDIAIGYDYEVMSGQLFQSVLLPEGIGDGFYSLLVWNGSDFVFDQVLSGGIVHTFANPLSKFRIQGIEFEAGLDPSDPMAFVTGLTFNLGGTVDMIMTPIVAVPETSSLFLGTVTALVAFLRTRRSRRL